MRRGLKLTGAIAGVVLTGGVAQAQTPAQGQGSTVRVELGPAVQARASDLGRSSLEKERLYLQQRVEQAVARRGGGPIRVRLVIQDIEPNLPTPTQLARSSSLNAASPGLGGAAITGEVVGADGVSRPVRYRFFQTDLRFELNYTIWGDAGEAFDTLARDIADGHPPDDPRPWPGPHQPRAPTGTLLR